jgi:hypothetical protein
MRGQKKLSLCENEGEGVLEDCSYILMVFLYLHRSFGLRILSQITGTLARSSWMGFSDNFGMGSASLWSKGCILRGGEFN